MIVSFKIISIELLLLLNYTYPFAMCCQAAYKCEYSFAILILINVVVLHKRALAVQICISLDLSNNLFIYECS